MGAESPAEFSAEVNEQAQEFAKQAKNLRISAKTAEDYDELTRLYKEIEKLYSPQELPPSLQEQYESQVEVLEKAGLLRKLESGKLGIEGIEGIDGKEYPLPAPEEVAKRMEANKELVERKQEQGFTRLLLVPFGMKLDDLIEAYKQRILDHSQKGKLFATKKDSGDPSMPLELNESHPLWKWDGYNNADATGELVYNPKEFSKNHKGKTKQEILEKQGGWQVLLIEDMSNIPREGGAKTKGGRTQIDTGGSSIKKYIKRGENIPSPAEYLKALNKEPAYNGESGMTPEEQLTYAILHLEETDQVIDDYRGNGSISYQIGAYFPSSGNAPNAYWNRDNRQANVDRNNPDNRNDNCGVRPAVRVYDYELTDFSHPPSILPASASFACVWNIFVSFAISSSKNNLSLRIDVSKRLDALIKYAAFKGLGAFFAIMVSCKSDKTLFSRLWPSEYLHLFSR